MLTILLSTTDDGIYKLRDAIRLKHPLLRYIIIHQTAKREIRPPYLRQRDDVEVIRSTIKGLSNSRNIGLKNCCTRYSWFLDDDVTIIEEGVMFMLDILRTEAPDFALFKIKTHPGEPEYKEYPKEPQDAGKLKHWVSSIEIIVDAEKLEKSDIYFDRRFGLGTRLDRGEEAILIHDLLQNGWSGRYYPKFLVNHAYESSGKRKRSSKKDNYFKGAYDARLGRKFRTLSIANYFSNPTTAIEDFYYITGRLYIQLSNKLINHQSVPQFKFT